jgi:phosphatidylserine synthase
MAKWVGWVATLLIVLAGLVPLAYRARLGKRAAPESTPIRAHVLIGLAVALVALLHTLAVMGALGSADAIEGGSVAFVPGVLAFFLLFAHVGVGLQLREPKLRDRPRKRRTHLATAIAIVIAAAVHVIALRLAP